MLHPKKQHPRAQDGHQTRAGHPALRHPPVLLDGWTLYPPGFAPFLRAPIAAAAGWMHTLFAAVLLAASGNPRGPDDSDPQPLHRPGGAPRPVTSSGRPSSSDSSRPTTDPP